MLQVVLTRVLFAALDTAPFALAVRRRQPLSMIVMAVPITLAGIGQRESAVVTLFCLAGASRAVALGAALLGFALHVVEALAGFAVLVVERRRDRGA